MNRVINCVCVCVCILVLILLLADDRVSTQSNNAAIIQEGNEHQKSTKAHLKAKCLTVGSASNNTNNNNYT